MKAHALAFLFQHPHALFPLHSSPPHDYIHSLHTSLTRAFLHADLAMSRHPSVSPSSGTTALTALLFGTLLLVANAGDCRAVLSRNGTALDLSHDHRPSHAPERHRVLHCGGFVDDGYLNGVLSVTRALGDWDIKCPHPHNTPCSTPSPLIADPEFNHTTLTPHDEFLIIASDGIWDVLSSQQAVSIVRRGLRRHDDPDRSARDLAMEALHLNTCDNLTVIVVCFSSSETFSTPEPVSRLRCCKSISPEALCKLRSCLEGQDTHGNN
ncbi:Protein phosphatase 2C-like protein [Rhynchospora pubera]|uniref:protein-serine/threonine phosphatase n=1 Tax=Rhynchospora pubera TaxID=906938 RepID=A0AAV8E8K5_9POAL|nr:Protein phosphatase 2C-like protein [Rhynchospora pubera]